MTTFNSDIANTPARTPRFGGVIGRKATFTVPTGMVLADDANMFTIPAGAVLLDMWATNDGGGQTADVGTAADDNFYLTAVADDDTADRVAAGAVLNAAVTEDTIVKVVFNTGNPTADGVVTVAATYMLTP